MKYTKIPRKPAVACREKRSIFAEHPPDIEDTGRRRFLIIFILFIIITMLFSGTDHIRSGRNLSGVIDCMLALVLCCFIFTLRRTKNTRTIYRILLAFLASILFYLISSGAGRGFAGIWVLTLPAFSFFLLGKREGLFWSIFIAAINAIVFITPGISITGFTYDTGFISIHLFSLTLITIIIYIYESIHEKYKNKIGSVRRLLIERQDHLESLVTEKTLQLQSNAQKLEDGEKRYRLLADNINEIIWAMDNELRFTYVSPSVMRMYGYTVEEAMALPHEKWNTPESYKRFIKALKQQSESAADTVTDRDIEVRLEHVKKDGSIMDVELKVSLVLDGGINITGYTGVAVDVTDRIKSEHEKERTGEQNILSQKMEAVAILSGGLAHDFNNFLGGIIGSFELIRKTLGNQAPENMDMLKKYLETGFETSRKSADLVKQLLVLSRRDDIHLAPMDINMSLKNVYGLCKNNFPDTIEVDFEPSGLPIYIMGDAAQVEHVLINLYTNASHAMTIMRAPGEKQGGKITVRAERISTDHIPAGLCGARTDTGAWTRISISDTGIGMDSETMSRIFVPFFSRKKKKEGTGLGLAVSYTIVQKHGGFIIVDSMPGTGSCFTLYLPLYDLLPAPGTYEKNMIEHGNSTILVIDDEIFMLNIAKSFLEDSGYDVLTAASPHEGIEQYRLHNKIISLVLIDCSMPGMTGLEVFAGLKRINKNVRTLLSCGMHDCMNQESVADEGIIGTVNKPYTPAELSVKIKKALESQPA